ncbi:MULTISPECIES: molybdopterin-dependent oxidoreductase [unclassified Chelatococcus]|uniref:molybdopterin-dependent oxidoreductase n=1 Tax=unclassified Chelatococcus TaxID=2638111 RepID=UPI001BD03BEB|nr:MULTISPECIES: molybdopterin-dependent oxidoreductase [unclassified Chelatococcus]MBS7697358.1 molybdopterin-dependent oxidoreductase [Chelatococcus sp. YT9]MBX3556345.1 molybdopterin-dependent oxidoreductase [Chelatococcus sp.]
MHLFGTHFGTYEVVHDGEGRAELRGFRRDPKPSPVGAAFLELADHPRRLRQPMVRQGWLAAPDGARDRKGRGREPFVPVDWDTAAKLVAGEITRIREAYGNEAIFAGSYGWASAGRFNHAPSQLKRFLNCCGGFVSSVNTYSYGAAAVLLPHIIGPAFVGATDAAPSWDLIAANARLVISFGGFRVTNAQVEAGGTGQHRAERWLERIVANGARVVVVSPVRTDVPEIEGREQIEYVAIRPNTDTAVMLAMAQVLLAEGLARLDFLDRYTAGFDIFAAYLTGASDGIVKTPEWAEGISGMPAETIRELARAFAEAPALINAAWSLQRARYGEQPYWASIALAAMAGQIGRPGAGFAFGLTAVSSVGQPIRHLRGPALPQGQNPVEAFIPVARITELLTRPGERLAYNGRELPLPDIRLVWWAGGNPFHHHQDLNRLAEAWRRPETVIVNESVWTATACHADIVLPASLPFERDDIAASSRDSWLVASRRIVEPPPNVFSDFRIFVRIARELGVEEAFTEGLDENGWLRRLYSGYRERHPELPDFETFQAEGFAGLDLGEEAAAPGVPFADFIADPVAHPLATPSGRIEIASGAIAGFGYPDIAGHPVWMPPEEWLGAPLAEIYPLHLLSPQPAHRLHSQLELVGESQRAKLSGHEVALLNPADAAARGIADGDIIEIFNARGRSRAGARLSAEVMAGVVVLPTGGWFDPVDEPEGGRLDRGGNPNVLTSDRPTSQLSGGPAPNSCLVDVRRA